MSLLRCAACKRHFRSTEAACPFCAASVASAVHPPRGLGRVSRAAAAAVALSSVAAIPAVVVGCGKESVGGIPPGANVYGAPPAEREPPADAEQPVKPPPSATTPDAGATAIPDAGGAARPTKPPPVMAPAYGAPPPRRP